jgi:Tol biopolymer transport system component
VERVRSMSYPSRRECRTEKLGASLRRDRKVTTLSWMPNGREIIFSSFGGHSGLLRILVAPGAEPHALPNTEDTSCPAMSVASHALFVFHHSRSGGNPVFHSEMPGSGRASPPTMLIGSTPNDVSAQYSPDGKKIVFASDRSGEWQIWTCDATDQIPSS